MNIGKYLNAKNYISLIKNPGKIIPTIKAKYNVLYNKAFNASKKKANFKELFTMHTNTINSLDRIAEYFNGDNLILKQYEDFYGTEIITNPDCQYLGSLFKNYGSDKSTDHNYYITYFAFLNPRRNEPLNVFEIGLGTNNIKYRANMGLSGRPGASLRAFRDFLPNASIYGADIDREVLFEEERIKTFFIDQLDPKVLEDVKQSFGDKKFDLIIDDGLHLPDANLNVVFFALDLLSENGILVIEDIKPNFYIYFRLLYSIIRSRYHMEHIKSGRLSLCIISKKK